jgi:hypothetical protein
MSIIAKKVKIDPAPEGLHQSVCIDVVDKGMQETGFGGMAHKIQLRWFIEELNPKTGKPYMVSRKFTNSLHEKSALRPFLESWRGRKFTPEELDGFDLEKLIGANCQLQIIHNIKEGGEVYSNVQAIVPPAKLAPKLAVPVDYVRQCDREKQQEIADDVFGGGEYKAQDSDVPF